MGDRVCIRGTDYTGRAQYVGTPSFAEGVWVGVELPSAVGNCDGSRDGEQYFPCKKNHGMFLLANACYKIEPKPSPFKVQEAFSLTVLVSSNAKHMLSVKTAQLSPSLSSARSHAAASPSASARPSAMLRKASPDKSTGPQSETKRSASAASPSSSFSPVRSPALAAHRGDGSGASGAGGGAVSPKDLADVLERVASLEKAQQESSCTLSTILSLVQEAVGQGQQQGQQQAFRKIAELAKKAHLELGK